MAKLKGPLFSFNASGKLADSLVYFPWKGLNVVRQYVIPANPKTALQQAQRGYLGDAVDAIHDALADATHPIKQVDITAYATLALNEEGPRTWFNQACKLWVDVLVAALTPCLYADFAISDKKANSIDLIAYLHEETASDLAAGKFYFGTSRTALIHAAAATVTAGVSVKLENEDCSAFLTAGQKYYVQFKPDAADPCEGADSGIYSFVAE